MCVGFIANKIASGHLSHKLANNLATDLGSQWMDPFFPLRHLQIGCMVCFMSGLPSKPERPEPETDH